MTNNFNTEDQDSLLEQEYSDLFDLASIKIKEAIEDTRNTRAKLNATLEKMDQSR